MSRYRGPRLRIMRAVGIELPGFTRKRIKNRTNPPGVHGEQGARRRSSDFKRQLVEKQKLRFNYGIGERQFRNLMREANQVAGAPGEQLLQYLERRLDNVVFRANLAPTIPAARQLVCHGHVVVKRANQEKGGKVDIPSFRVAVGDVVTVREKSRGLTTVIEALEQPTLEVPEWIALDKEKCEARVIALPTSASVPFPIDIHLVVEFYTLRI